MNLLNTMLIIKNDNYNLAETNYWETELSKNDLFYMSLNDGMTKENCICHKIMIKEDC